MSAPAKWPLTGMLAMGGCAAVLVAVALALIHPWGNLRGNPSGGILSGSTAPQEVRTMLAQKCGDCHSTGTRWPLYSRIAPASWLLEYDVKGGREHLNFSSWDQYSNDTRIDLLAKIGTQLRQEKMPLKRYLLLHPSARVSESERKLISDWTKLERRRLVAAAEK